MKNEVKGYKVFNPDWTCRGYRYAVGMVAETDEEIGVCTWGFHFCINPAACFNYYNFDPRNKVAEVVARGRVKTEGDKSVTDKLEIVREIPWEEVLRLVNTGAGNSGLSNSGNRNSGNRNSGDFNSGNRNSGDFNSGNRNSGNRNSGDFNSGNRNSGDFNSGDFNSGDFNSGDFNSGNRNSGNRNSGDFNSGDFNSGNRNSGNRNSGDFNSGNRNSGDFNSGDFNKTDCSGGCFCTEEPKIYLFNKPSPITLKEWWNSNARWIMLHMPTKNTLEWVNSANMTDKEKADHPEHETTGGFLRMMKPDETAQHWWKGLSEEARNAVLSLPNFDAEIFRKITGIRV